MIQIFYQEEPGPELRIEGHAGFDIKGRDVVCAAVSALAETLALNLERLQAARIKRSSGQLVLELLEGADAAAKIILAATLAGLQVLARQYPEQIELKGAALSRGEEKYGT